MRKRRRSGSASLPIRETPMLSSTWRVMYSRGEGVPEDCREAVKWLAAWPLSRDSR